VTEHIFRTGRVLAGAHGGTTHIPVSFIIQAEVLTSADFTFKFAS
jgi:hypothetical protein